MEFNLLTFGKVVLFLQSGVLSAATVVLPECVTKKNCGCLGTTERANLKTKSHTKDNESAWVLDGVSC